VALQTRWTFPVHRRLWTSTCTCIASPQLGCAHVRVYEKQPIFWLMHCQLDGQKYSNSASFVNGNPCIWRSCLSSGWRTEICVRYNK